MHSDLGTRVIAFVADYTASNPASLCLDTTLRDDLCLDGDDAEDLIVDFSREFRVNTEGFEFSKHFGPEGCFPPAALYYWFRGNVAPLRIRDLVEAAERGEFGVTR